MLAVYKKELKTYFTSVIGYLFISFIPLLIGRYFTSYNIGAAYPKFEVTLSAGTFVFLIAVPILTMRILAEERRQKTDQLLFTSPVSIGRIVMGKYLALVTIYLVPIVILCFYPLILRQYGEVTLGSAYSAIYVCGDREPGNRGGAYVFSVVCLPCDRRNFFLFFRNSIYLLCGFCRGVGCPYMGIVYDDS